jgi:hypothetical protein
MKIRVLMCSIQLFSNNKEGKGGVITFSFELRIKCYKGLGMLWLKEYPNSGRPIAKKCTVIKRQET